MIAKTTKQVRLKRETVQRAVCIKDRTGIAEKTVYSMAVEAGMPSVERAAAKIKQIAGTPAKGGIK